MIGTTWNALPPKALSKSNLALLHNSGPKHPKDRFVVVHNAPPHQPWTRGHGPVPIENHHKIQIPLDSHTTLSILRHHGHLRVHTQDKTIFTWNVGEELKWSAHRKLMDTAKDETLHILLPRHKEDHLLPNQQWGLVFCLSTAHLLLHITRNNQKGLVKSLWTHSTKPLDLATVCGLTDWETRMNLSLPFSFEPPKTATAWLKHLLGVSFRPRPTPPDNHTSTQDRP